MRKDELRQQMRQLKRQYTQQQLEVLSLPIVARLKARLKDAQTIVAYYSLPDEVNTHQLIDDLVAEGKTVLLPKVVDEERMVLCRYTGRHDLQEGAFHIMEPVGEPFTDYQQIDVVLVPGMAFDAQGHRLGRGKGYYDRFLSHLSTLDVSHRARSRIPEHSSPTRSLSEMRTSSHFSHLIATFTIHFIGVSFAFQKLPAVPVEANDIPVTEVI